MVAAGFGKGSSRMWRWAAIIGWTCALVLAGQAPAKTPTETPAETPTTLAPHTTLAPNELLRPDPGVVFGRLPNRLRYAVKQHPSHQKEVIEFYVAAGSLDERADERGVAHFLEHMAFNGSRDFPADSLIKTFQNAGIGFGRDQNASTGYFGTTYLLDIPNETPEKLDLGFRWLRDVADGLLLAPAEVDRERGVVLSEYREGLGPGRTLYEQRQHFLIPDLRPTDRTPIGERAVIEGADARTIRGFYERWYRPENVIVVALGDEPVEVMKARIEAAFASWRNPTAEPQRAPIGAVDLARPSAAKDLTDPHIPTGVDVCRYSVKPPHTPEDVDITREHAIDRIWSSVFARRAAREARHDDPAFLSAAGASAISYRTVGETCFAASARMDDWRAAVRGLATDIRRLELYGVTQKEFDEARHRILAGADADVAAASTMAPEPLANSLLGNMIEGDTFDTFEEERRVFRLALQGVTPASVAAQFRRRWTDAAAPLFLVSGPAPVASGEVAAVWREALNSNPAPPEDAARTAWAYGDAPTAGQVVRRTLLTDPDFTRFTYGNGLVLNFKHTDFSRNQVSIRIRFGAGEQELPPGRAFDATVAAPLVYSGGLKRNDVDDINELCQGHVCGARLQVGRDAFNLYASTRSGDLDLELQILDGLLTEPGFRPSMARAMPTVAADYFREIRLNPSVTASLKLLELMPRPHVADLPIEAHLAGLTAEDFRGLLAAPMTQDPLEVSIVGDVDEAAALAAVGHTLAVIPARTPGDRTRPDAIRSHYAHAAPPPATAWHDGPKDQAVVQITWPLFVWTSERTHEARTVDLLVRIMQDDLTERIRQKLGKSYSPSVGASLPRGGDQGSITLLAKTSPDGVEAVRAEALGIAADLAAGRLTPAAVEEARRPWLEALAKERTYNGWWLNVLDGSARHPDQLDRARGDLADIRRITLAEVKLEAARWLSKPPYVVVALPEGAPSPTP